MNSAIMIDIDKFWSDCLLDKYETCDEDSEHYIEEVNTGDLRLGFQVPTKVTDSPLLQLLGNPLLSPPEINIKNFETAEVNNSQDSPGDKFQSFFRSPIQQKNQNAVVLSREEALVRLIERTRYPIMQENGQRRYGPPPDWIGPPPNRGCEIFIGKIPRDCFEDELVPIFESVGKVYMFRLMMDFSGCNRGYGFCIYTNREDTRQAVTKLDSYEIRKSKLLGVCFSVDNCRLFVGGIPKTRTKEEIFFEMMKVTEGVRDVIVYPSVIDKTKNRGFAFVEYENHKAAAMARRKLIPGRIHLWGHQVAVDWAEPEREVDEDVMMKVRILYVRNLMLHTTEETLRDQFNLAAGSKTAVERVKKMKDYAFIHFRDRDLAANALTLMDGYYLDGSRIEVNWAKPADKNELLRIQQNALCSISPVFSNENVGHSTMFSNFQTNNDSLGLNSIQSFNRTDFQSMIPTFPVQSQNSTTPFEINSAIRKQIMLKQLYCQKELNYQENKYGNVPTYQDSHSMNMLNYLCTPPLQHGVNEQNERKIREALAVSRILQAERSRSHKMQNLNGSTIFQKSPVNILKNPTMRFNNEHVSKLQASENLKENIQRILLDLKNRRLLENQRQHNMPAQIDVMNPMTFNNQTYQRSPQVQNLNENQQLALAQENSMTHLSQNQFIEKSGSKNKILSINDSKSEMSDSRIIQTIMQDLESASLHSQRRMNLEASTGGIFQNCHSRSSAMEMMQRIRSPRFQSTAVIRDAQNGIVERSFIEKSIQNDHSGLQVIEANSNMITKLLSREQNEYNTSKLINYAPNNFTQYSSDIRALANENTNTYNATRDNKPFQMTDKFRNNELGQLNFSVDKLIMDDRNGFDENTSRSLT